MYYLNQPNLLIRKIFYNHLDHGSPKVFSTSSNINYPLVSVLIPLYNHEKYIIECLDSIIFQNYPNLEIVLVDDASQDEGLQKAKHRLSTCNFNYIILENNLNLGICATLNRAVSKARGKYVCFIASDDLLAKGRIRKHIEVLEKSDDSSIIACHGPIQIFETNSSKIVLKKNQQKKNNYSLDSVLLKTNKINLQGCTFFKEKLIKFPF